MGFGDASASATCVVIYVVWTDGNGVHHPRVLTGRCRVAPLLGATIPRGELQALVILHRLIAVVVETFPFRFRSISTFSDSLCSIGAMAKPSSGLRPYFANRVLEVLRLRELLQADTSDLAPISHVPGSDNPADIGTRGSVGVEELGQGSRWQTGPDFMKQDYEMWPRTSGDEAAAAEVPAEEVRAFFGSGAAETPVEALVKMIGTPTKLGRALSEMASHALRREKLEMLVRVLARVLQAVLSGRRGLRQKPLRQDGRDCCPFAVARWFQVGRGCSQGGKASGAGSRKPGRRCLGVRANQRRPTRCASRLGCPASPTPKRGLVTRHYVEVTPGGP